MLESAILYPLFTMFLLQFKCTVRTQQQDVIVVVVEHKTYIAYSLLTLLKYLTYLLETVKTSLWF